MDGKRVVVLILFSFLLIGISVSALSTQDFFGFFKKGITGNVVWSDVNNTNFIKNTYQYMLHRDANSSELISWASQLDRGLQKKEFVYKIYITSEYQTLNKINGLSNEEFVEFLYNDLLGRKSDSGGFSYWLRTINSGMSRSSVAKSFILSPEFERVFGTYNVKVLPDLIDNYNLPKNFKPIVGYYFPMPDNRSGGRINLWDAQGQLFVYNGSYWFNRTNTKVSSGLPDDFKPVVGFYSPAANNQIRVHLFDAGGQYYVYNGTMWTNQTRDKSGRFGKLPKDFKPIVGLFHPFSAPGRINLWDAQGQLYIYNGTGWFNKTGSQESLGLPNSFKPFAGYYNPIYPAKVELFAETGKTFVYNGTRWINKSNTIQSRNLPFGQSPNVAYYDAFSKRFVLWYGNEAYESKDGNNFERVIFSQQVNRTIIPPSDGVVNISIETTKRYYELGDNIKITDPPEDNLEGSSTKPAYSLLEGGFESRDAEIEGYIVQLNEKPVVERELELKKELADTEKSFEDYSLKSQKAFIAVKPYYNLQLNREKTKYESLKSNYPTEIENSKQKIVQEHETFLNSAGISNIGKSINSPNVNLNSKVKREFNYAFNGYVLNISKQEAERIGKLSGVKKVYPNYKVKAFLDSSVLAMDLDFFRNQTGLTGKGVVVAVIDTGIDATHESLDDLDDDANTSDPKVIGWMDFVNFRTEPYDDHGHGTHCSGIATGTGGSSKYKGVAPEAQLVGVKVLDEGGSGSFSDVIAGIEWTIQHKEEYNISIISMSLGTNVNGDGTSPVEVAADYAVESGINFIVAAGNDGAWGPNTVGIPASAKNVVTVGAVDDNLDIAYFSSRGPTKDGRIKPEVSAVGVDVTSSIPGKGYEEWSGTSMATPHVAGFVALLLEQNPSLNPVQVKKLLTDSALDKGVSGPDNDYGYGVVSGLETLTYTDPPQHEISLISLSVRNYLILNEETKISSEVKNYGTNSENIEIKLLVDNKEIEIKNMAILSKEIKTIEFNYTETVKGVHNTTVFVTLVPGELVLDNNRVSKEVNGVTVSGTIKAVVVDSWGNYKPEYTIFDELKNNWFNYGSYTVDIDYNSLKKSDFTYEDIAATNADVLILSNAWANGDFGMYLQYTNSEVAAIKRYVEEGHGLIGTSGTLSELVPNNMKLAELFGLDDNLGLWNDAEASGGDAVYGKNMDVLVDDLLTKDIPAKYMPFEMTVLNLKDDKTKTATRVAELDGRDDVFVSAFKPVLGASVYFTNMVEYDSVGETEKQFFYNSIVWTKNNTGELTKDVLIYGLQMPERSKLNQPVQISAKVKNNGVNVESNIRINLLIDGTVKETRTISSLSAGQEQAINFSFAPNEAKKYNVNIEVLPQNGETYLINNNLRKQLTVPGILMNGNNGDYLVDIGNDTKYDYLAISVGVDVVREGEYNVKLDLESYLGVELYNGYKFIELNPRSNNITVLIPLQTIKKYQLNGPYKVKNIRIFSYGKESTLEDSNETGFVTGPYKYASFRDPAQIVAGSFSDYGLDENSNKLYDKLVVKFNVNVPVAGDYSIDGRLSSYTYANSYFYFDKPGIYEVNLSFSGVELRKNKVNGPYNLEKVSIYSNTFESEVSGEVYTTNEYKYEDFEKLVNLAIRGSYNDYLIVGEAGQISVQLYNEGTEDTGPFNLYLYLEDEDNSSLIGSRTFKNIDINSFERASFAYTPATTGYLKFKVAADINDGISEDNVDYFSTKSYPFRGADLNIYPSYWNTVFVIGEQSKVNFEVSNNGVEEARNVVVDLYSVSWYYNETSGENIENLTLIGSNTLGNIPVWDYVRESIDYTPTNRYNNLKIIVRTNNEVFPGDNLREFQIEAKVRGADLRLEIAYDQLNFVVGSSNLINISVRNIGTEKADSLVLNVFSMENYGEGIQNLTLIGRSSSGELLPDASQLFSFVYVAKEKDLGWKDFKANVTCTNEADSLNNEDYFSRFVVSQSKITNNGPTEVSGKLFFEIDKLTGEEKDWNWTYFNSTNKINLVIPAGRVVKLDKIFNLLNLSIGQAGEYRVCSNFESGITYSSCGNFHVY
ncbi:MAG: S8 family serine peptidase [Candidatus Pacearchaeota archaeon]|jgi:serine protease AprX